MPTLTGSSAPLHEAHDVAMLDLDGVVYVGPDAVPGAPDHLAAAREAGLRLAFVTNNASRPPAQVATHLTELGVPASAEDVVTSAQAAARVLVDRWGTEEPVAVLGAAGLREALAAAGLRAVAVDDEAACAVVTGYGPDVVWNELMRAAVRIRDGLPWVATNTDLTIPTAYGTAPGHGVQVRMLSDFTGVVPTVAGKPERPLLDETVRRMDARRPLMVGDRLDTDIVGAVRAEVDSLLVLTGVTGLSELLGARPGERPSYLARDLGGLTSTHPEVETAADGSVAVGGWTARVDGGGALAVTGEGEADDWWRAVAVCGWAHLDASGTVASHEDLHPPR